MALLEEAIFSRAGAIAPLAALIGTRLYPVILPQNPTLPAATYRRISTRRPNAMGRDPGIAFARIQFTAWATTPLGAKQVKEAIRGDSAGAGYQRWRGTVAGVAVLDSILISELEFYDETSQLFAAAADFVMPHREA